MSKESDKKKLLIIEDDPGLMKQLCWHFEQYEVVTATNRPDAIAAVRLHEPEVILQDLGLPPDDEGVSEGFRCIEEISAMSPATKIIVMTGNAEYENAVRSVGFGAYDFCQKPVQTETLDLILERAYHIYALEAENRCLLEQQQDFLEGIITADPVMLKICRTLGKLANADVTCTILGESGTGKEVVTRAIHNLSDRKHQRFVAINCAAVPETIMESELFGHEKGAFTGAHKQTKGKIETAHEGTLFLDEIGDMPLNLQAKLLRFLQERVIERVGGRDEIEVDVKVVCATNKDLASMIQEGTFREDLYYRITEMVIELPPLRDRIGDKTLLARHFLKKFAINAYSHIGGFSPDALNAIDSYSWPGNIRELENKVKRAVIMADDKLVTAMDLGLREVEQPPMNLRQIRQNSEKEAILQALNFTDYNMSATAKLLGISRPTLYDLLKKNLIKLPESTPKIE